VEKDLRKNEEKKARKPKVLEEGSRSGALGALGCRGSKHPKLSSASACRGLKKFVDLKYI